MFCAFNFPFIGACPCMCPISWSLFSESNILSGVFCLLQGPPLFVPQRYCFSVRLLHKVNDFLWLLGLSHYLLVGLILSFLGTCLSLPSGPVYLVKKKLFACILTVQEKTHNVHLSHDLFLTCTQQSCNFLFMKVNIH
jgi:hypothetical protein